MEGLINFSDNGMYMKIKQPEYTELLTVKGHNYNLAALKIQEWWRKWSTLKEIKRLKIKQTRRNAIYIPNTIVPTKRKFSEISEECETTEENNTDEDYEILQIKEIHRDLFSSIYNFVMSILHKFKFW